MDLELGPEFDGVLRKAPQVFVQIGRFAILLAEDDFTVNQVQQLFVVDDLLGILLAKGLDRQPSSVAPVLAMNLNERERARTRSRSERRLPITPVKIGPFRDCCSSRQFVQSHFECDPIDRANQSLAKRLGARTKLGGNLSPLSALFATIEDFLFVG